MARRRKGFIELEWTCPNCETRNRGSEKTCASCGAPQPEDVQFDAPTKRKMVEANKARELEKRSADIHCGFCGTRNPSDAKTCSQCGADLKEGKARQAGREIDMSAKTPAKVDCANCGAENAGTKASCEECGAPLPRQSKPEPASGSTAFSMPAVTASAAPAKKKPKWWLWAGMLGVLAVCCLAILLLFVFPSQSVTATVTEVYWQTSVPVQEIRTVQYDDQPGNPPSDAYNVSCRTKSKEFCEEKTIDRGDGFAEVVEDCRIEEQQYCDYTLDEWTTIQTYTLDGYDLYPAYEHPSITSDQRLGTAKEMFTVTFSTDQGQKSYTPDSLSEFQQFHIGSTWTLRLNALGGVISVER
ncbi:MAG: hypothetical protein Kow002_11530 [Anaerolineales bacterium]